MPSDVATSLGRLSTDPGFLLARFSRIATRAANDALTDLEMSTRMYSVLEIGINSNGVSQREVGTLLRLDPSAIVALVDELSDKGLIQRAVDPQDRRRVQLEVTPAGRALADVAAGRLRATFDSLLGEHLGTDRADDFIDALSGLALSTVD